jgi:ParB-like chromosome segregation protein Spo0J
VNNGHPEFTEMPFQVKDLSDQQMADLVMEANTIRKDLNPIDLARLYKRYLEDFGITQAELARKHNVSQGEVANTIRLLELPEDIQAKIISQEISETHGRQLLRLSHNHEHQKGMLAAIIEKGYSVNYLSDQIANKIYYASANLEPDDYPKPEFDTKGCEQCPSRQKIGTPYSKEKKSWRCVDKSCYEKKTKQAEQERVDQLQVEIAEAKKKAGDKKKDKVLDLSKLTYRDYERLDDNYKKIDKTECRNCPKRAVGKGYGGKPESVCVDVKCFKSKEKAYQDKETAKLKEAEKTLTERVKAVGFGITMPEQAHSLIATYLLSHCRKDTRERTARLLEVLESELQQFITDGDGDAEIDELKKLACLVLQMERYEGDKGFFKKMLADLEGNSDEIDKALAEHRAKHCKGCKHDDGNCKQLFKRWGEGWHDKCYSFSKASAKDVVESAPQQIR